MTALAGERRYVVVLPDIGAGPALRYWTGRTDMFGAPEATGMLAAAQDYAGRDEARTAALVAGLSPGISVRPVQVTARKEPAHG